MEKRCILKNCRNSSDQCTMFQFPFEKAELLKEWLVKIPKNLYTIITNPSFICEKHFEPQFLKIEKGVNRLKPQAVPNIFENSEQRSRDNQELDDSITSSSCRFCLKIFEEDEKHIAINQNIRKQFLLITQVELDRSKIFSQNICECCFDSSQNHTKFRLKLIQSQQKLEKDFQMKNDEEVDNRMFHSESMLECDKDGSSTIEEKKHSCDLTTELSEVLCEEYLDPEIENILIAESSEGQQEVDLTFCDRESRNKKKIERSKLCPECGKTYASHAYKRHYERVHMRLKNYHCDFCNYKAYSRSHIEIHVRSHLKIKTHLCTHCGTAFGSGNILRQHFLTHQNDRPFNCDHPDCLLSFKSVYALRRHQKTHSSVKLRFACDECSSKFTDKWHLKRHKNGHQPQAHPCSMCDKVFQTKERVKAHQIYHKPPQFQCGSCNKEFYKKPDLKTHLKTHTGQKDFQCNICSNSYFKNSHLSRHMKIHMINTRNKVFI